MHEMLNFIKKLYTQESFQPTFVGLFVNPFYFARKALYERIKTIAPCFKGRALDIGCGQKPYQNLFCNVTKYTGLEIDTLQNRLNKKADHFFDGKSLPYEDSSFNTVIMSQVLEHIFSPDSFLSEVNRVMCDDAKLLITVPFVWDEHEQPHDFARYSSYGLTALLERNGLIVVEHYKTVADARAIFQLINAYLYKVYCHSNQYFIILVVLLIATINVLGAVLYKIMPDNQDLYIDNIVIAKKTQVR